MSLASDMVVASTTESTLVEIALSYCRCSRSEARTMPGMRVWVIASSVGLLQANVCCLAVEKPSTFAYITVSAGSRKGQR